MISLGRSTWFWRGASERAYAIFIHLLTRVHVAHVSRRVFYSENDDEISILILYRYRKYSKMAF